MSKSYNEFQLSAMKSIDDLVNTNLNKFYPEHNWTKEQLLNIFMFFSFHHNGYGVRYVYEFNKVEVFDVNEEGKYETEFSTYDEFIDWFNDRKYSC